MTNSVDGRLAIDGAPVAAAEVVLCADDGAALAATTTDAAGRFALAAPAGFSQGWVLAKLHAPVVGGAAARVTAGTPVLLALKSQDARTLAVTIRLPDGATTDWYDVHLTPRALPGVPEAVAHAFTLVGTGPSRYGTWHTARVSEPRARLRVLPGTWELQVDHIVERASTVFEQPPNWSTAAATLSDGRRLTEYLDAVRIEITRDLEATVELKRFEG